MTYETIALIWIAFLSLLLMAQTREKTFIFSVILFGAIVGTCLGLGNAIHKQHQDPRKIVCEAELTREQTCLPIATVYAIVENGVEGEVVIIHN